MPLTIEAIPALETNYIWALHDGKHCALVDPGSSEEPLAWLRDNGLTLCALLLTHHHPDHIGGADALLEHRSVPVWGPDDSRITQVDRVVKEGTPVSIPELEVDFQVLETPGHTSSHIVFLNDDMVFAGDTLFSIGCGRLFEGTPEQMQASLDKLANVPDEARVYCGHEYTADNCRFALQVEPGNPILRTRADIVERLREAGRPTLPSTMGDERAANPFLRTREPAIIEAAKEREPGTAEDPAAVFGVIRRWKDQG